MIPNNKETGIMPEGDSPEAAGIILSAVERTTPVRFLADLKRGGSGVTDDTSGYSMEQVNRALKRYVHEIARLTDKTRELLTVSPVFMRKPAGTDTTLELSVENAGRTVRTPEGEHVIDHPQIWGISLVLKPTESETGRDIILEGNITVSGNPFAETAFATLFEMADGFCDYRYGNPRAKKYLMNSLNERRETLGRRLGRLATLEECIDDPVWRESAAGFWQAYRFIAANLLAWQTPGAILPEQLVDPRETNPLNKAGIAYR